MKQQYYWKAMKKDIHKYITNCALCKGEKERAQVYPLQMTDVPDRPFDKIAIVMVTDIYISTSRNQHILTIIDILTGSQSLSNFHQESRHHCLSFHL